MCDQLGLCLPFAGDEISMTATGASVVCSRRGIVDALVRPRELRDSFPRVTHVHTRVGPTSAVACFVIQFCRNLPSIVSVYFEVTDRTSIRDSTSFVPTGSSDRVLFRCRF